MKFDVKVSTQYEPAMKKGYLWSFKTRFSNLLTCWLSIKYKNRKIVNLSVFVTTWNSNVYKTTLKGLNGSQDFKKLLLVWRIDLINLTLDPTLSDIDGVH